MGEPVAASLSGTADPGAIGPFRVAFVLLAVLLVVPLVQVLRLPRSAGAAVTGRG